MSDITWRKAKKNEKKFLPKVVGAIKENRKLMAEVYRDIGMGDAFYCGKQYGDWDEKALSWRNEDITEEDEPRLISNQVKIYTDQAIAKITRYRPSIMGTPEGNEEKDIRGSKVAEELLQHEMREHNFTDLDERWVKSAAKTGIGWIKVDWNPYLGEEVIQDRSEEEDVSVEVKQVFQGDIEYSLPRSMNMVWDRSAVLWKDCKWVIEESFEDPDTLAVRFPKHADKIRAQVKKANHGEDIGYSDTGEKKLETTLVKTWRFYHKQTNEFPEGCEAYGIENAVFAIDDFPFDHGKLPYVPLIYSTSDEYLVGQAIPQVMFELQVEYNKIKNVKMMNQNYSSAIKFLNPTGSNYDSDFMTNAPGECVDYDGEIKPEWSQPQPVSQELNDSLDRIKGEMQDASFVGATSQGKPPEGIRSGIAIQYLIENDDLNFAGIIRRRDEGILEMCYMVLELMKQFYADEDGRYYKVIGDNKSYQLKKFKKANLKGKYDIVIQNSNSNPLSKAYKMDTIIQLAQYGIVDQNDRSFIAEALEMGNLKGIYEDLDADILRANKEIDKILQGQPHEMLPVDDHLAHYNTKTRYLKTEYDNLSPEQRQMLLQAIEQHNQVLQQQQQQQMMAQMQQQQGGKPQQQQQGSVAPPQM